jgi:type III secretion protein V
MKNTILLNAKSHPELILLVLIVTIIAMLIIPLPTPLVDLLLAVNISIALLVLIGSFYVDRILSFSSFPSILLITTLFRLGLSISTSRLILLNADAGHIINTFGEYVIGDNLVVGFVIFLIITVVQFIVITKGSERVAEVAARFSLDGMPGKQMSIDADIRAGTIDAATGQTRRSDLQKESQLYGSFDGAMKFIKGDAIAGIIIIFVNFIGGVSVGMVQHGISFSEALQTYTILTIGDGLVAQIPALLISISAGFVVTRVSGEGNNMGHSIVTQLFSQSFVILVTAILIFAMGLLPGFPLPVFTVLSIALFALYWSRRKPKAAESGKEKSTDGTISQDGTLEQPNVLDTTKMTIETVPLIFMVAEENKVQWEKKNILDVLRSRFFLDYGVRLPQAVVRYSAKGARNKVGIYINEVKAQEINCLFDSYRIVDFREELNFLDLELTTIEEPLNEKAIWVSAQQAAQVENMGCTIRKDVDDFYMSISLLLTRNIHEFFGVQETKNLLDELEPKYPELLKETYRHSSVQKMSEVLQRLLCERISVRNIKLILDAMTKWAPKEKDVITLVEHIRSALNRYISDKFSGSGKIRAIMVSQNMEEIVRNGIKQTSMGTFLNLEPHEMAEVMDLFEAGLSSIAIQHKDLVVLTSIDVRRFVKKLLESKYADLEVLSFGEITDSIQIDVLKTI